VILDTIGQPLAIISHQLDALQHRYQVIITQPVRTTSSLEIGNLFVIRQRISPDGVYYLVAAAKMGKG
jgi:hypothetical protein